MELHDGMRFGPFGRYMLRFHKSEREGVESMWIVLDAETPDEITGRPGIVRQAYTPDDAVMGLETRDCICTWKVQDADCPQHAA